MTWQQCCLFDDDPMLPTSHRRPWTEDDDAQLQRLVAHLDLSDVAEMMRRSFTATQHRCYVLGIKYTMACASCGKRFPVSPGHVTCSQACSDDLRLRPRRNVTCGLCGEAFDTRRSKQKYCSQTCASRALSVRIHYGLLDGELLRMFLSQNGRCAICDCRITLLGAHVDHCHDLHHVRGLLCQKCNTAIIGGAGDDPIIHIRAAAYLLEREVDAGRVDVHVRALLANIKEHARKKRRPSRCEVFWGRNAALEGGIPEWVIDRFDEECPRG